MPQVITIRHRMQAVPAVNRYLARCDRPQVALLFFDPALLSQWLSTYSEEVNGRFPLLLRESRQSELLEKWTLFAKAEERIPGSRNDLLFQLLHEPSWGHAPFALARLSRAFYRSRKEKSFLHYLARHNARSTAEDGIKRHALLLLEWSNADQKEEAFCRYFYQKSSGIASLIWSALLEKQEKIIYSNSAQARVSVYFNETPPGSEVLCILPPTDDSCPAAADRIVFSEKTMGDFPLPRIPLLPEDEIESALRNYTLSVSHLNTLLRCPLSFYFDVVIRAPGGKSAAMAFGSAVHEALEKAFRQMLRSNEKAFPPLPEITTHFHEAMEQYRPFFNDPEYFDQRTKYGASTLEAYFKRNLSKWNRIATVEKRIRTEVEGIPIHGFMDKIEFDYYRADIIDYKTGQIKGNEHRFAKPGSTHSGHEFEQAFGGNYWRQAVFYHLLVDHDNGNRWKAQRVVFDYIEKQEEGEQQVEIRAGKEEKTLVKEQILKAWSLIKEHRFDTGCGEPDCHWCRFVIENDLISSPD